MSTYNTMIFSYAVAIEILSANNLDDLYMERHDARAHVYLSKRDAAAAVAAVVAAADAETFANDAYIAAHNSVNACIAADDADVDVVAADAVVKSASDAVVHSPVIGYDYDALGYAYTTALDAYNTAVQKVNGTDWGVKYATVVDNCKTAIQNAEDATVAHSAAKSALDKANKTVATDIDNADYFDAAYIKYINAGHYVAEYNYDCDNAPSA